MAIFTGCIELCRADDYITVLKKNVVYKFVHFDKATDHFTQNVFPSWENETFDVFDKVKDPQGIAIDIGAWIGTTAIWLSKNFSHVIAIDADRVSLKCLALNLAASECNNVSICDRPIAQTSQKFIFGPRGDELNESISYIKEEMGTSPAHSTNDYIVRGLPFKQLVHDYIYANNRLPTQKISFIKCDIEGGEENIIEDLLYFAYFNKTKVYLSFHLSWWKSKKITDFEYLFKFFKTNCPRANICEYIKHNPFASLLFEPIESKDTLIKKNVPAVIIGYNQYTYIKNMVAQLEKYTTDIIVVDNNSTYKPLVDYYENDFKYTLLKQKRNYGHTVFQKGFVQDLVGDIYILTDPDLEFNHKLPANFIQVLIDVSNHFSSYKTGFALLIDADDIRTDIKLEGKSIKEWEKPFWQNKLHHPGYAGLELYRAALDTTFCVVNKKYGPWPHNNIRVAGNYTCKHIPWHTDFKDKLIPGEYEAYSQSNISTNWFKRKKLFFDELRAVLIHHIAAARTHHL